MSTDGLIKSLAIHILSNKEYHIYINILSGPRGSNILIQFDRDIYIYIFF